MDEFNVIIISCSISIKYILLIFTKSEKWCIISRKFQRNKLKKRFYPSDLVNTKTIIPLKVGEERWIYTRLCSNGVRSPEASNIWPWATENIFLHGRPAGQPVGVAKSKKKMLFNRERVDIQRSFRMNSHVT